VAVVTDGTRAEVDALPLLSRPIFEPLPDPSCFAQMSLDAACGTVVWPSGADFAPEAFHALTGAKSPSPAVQQSGAA
jgi:hypothetical protein